jgi:hypothetical protein
MNDLFQIAAAELARFLGANLPALSEDWWQPGHVRTKADVRRALWGRQLAGRLRVAMDAGPLQVLISTVSTADFGMIPGGLFDNLRVDFYADPSLARHSRRLHRHRLARATLLSTSLLWAFGHGAPHEPVQA